VIAMEYRFAIICDEEVVKDIRVNTEKEKEVKENVMGMELRLNEG